MSGPAGRERKHGPAVTRRGRGRRLQRVPAAATRGESAGRLCARPAAEVGGTHFTGEDRAGQQPVGPRDSPATTELPSSLGFCSHSRLFNFAFRF